MKEKTGRAKRCITWSLTVWLGLILSGSWDGISSYRGLCTFSSSSFAIVCTIIITEKRERRRTEKMESCEYEYEYRLFASASKWTWMIYQTAFFARAISNKHPPSPCMPP
jgi:hypothetical protein